MIYTAFLVGLFGSLHCIGMCGPIALMLPLDRHDPINRLVQVFLYHAGRLLSYGLIGLFFGWIGQGIVLSGFQQQLSIVLGVLIVLIVVLPDKWLHTFSLTKPLYLMYRKVQIALGRQLKRRGAFSLLFIGITNGFLPCGLVYLALFGAVGMGKWAEGVLYMVLFGLGTIPMMTAASYLGNFLSAQARKNFQRLVPAFVLVIGTLFILRGMGLGIPYVSPVLQLPTVQAEVECLE